MNQKISIGRIVTAIVRARRQLVERPAIVTRTWGEGATAVQATVFPDAVNDGLGDVMPMSSLIYDESGKAENSWRWPVVETPLAVKLETLKSLVVDWVGLHNKATELCAAIEKLPPSGEATNLSLAASDLAQAIHTASKGAN